MWSYQPPKTAQRCWEEMRPISFLPVSETFPYDKNVGGCKSVQYANVGIFGGKYVIGVYTARM